MGARQIAALAVLAALVGWFSWMLRYDVRATSTGESHGVYVLDRWTGHMAWCYGLQCLEVFPPPRGTIDPDLLVR
jgi:hypothetical protein